MSVPFKYKQKFRDLFDFATQSGNMTADELTNVDTYFPKGSRSSTEDILEKHKGSCPLSQEEFMPYVAEMQKETGVGYDDLAWGYCENYGKQHVFEGQDDAELKSVRSLVDPSLKPMKREPELTTMWSGVTSTEGRIQPKELVVLLQEMAKTLPMLDIYRMLKPKGRARVRRNLAEPGSPGSPTRTEASAPSSPAKAPPPPPPPKKTPPASPTTKSPPPPPPPKKTAPPPPPTKTAPPPPVTTAPPPPAPAPAPAPPAPSQSERVPTPTEAAPTEQPPAVAEPPVSTTQDKEENPSAVSPVSVPVPAPTAAAPATAPAPVPAPKVGTTLLSTATARRTPSPNLDALSGIGRSTDGQLGLSSKSNVASVSFALSAKETVESGTSTEALLAQEPQLPKEVTSFLGEIDGQRDKLQAALEAELAQLKENTDAISVLKSRLQTLEEQHASSTSAAGGGGGNAFLTGLDNEQSAQREKLKRRMQQWVDSSKSQNEVIKEEIRALKDQQQYDAARLYMHSQLTRPGAVGHSSAYADPSQMLSGGSMYGQHHPHGVDVPPMMTGAGAESGQNLQAFLDNRSSARTAHFYEQIEKKQREIKEKEASLAKMKQLEKKEMKMMREIEHMESVALDRVGQERDEVAKNVEMAHLIRDEYNNKRNAKKMEELERSKATVFNSGSVPAAGGHATNNKYMDRAGYTPSTASEPSPAAPPPPPLPAFGGPTHQSLTTYLEHQQAHMTPVSAAATRAGAAPVMPQQQQQQLRQLPHLDSMDHSGMFYQRPPPAQPNRPQNPYATSNAAVSRAVSEQVLREGSVSNKLEQYMREHSLRQQQPHQAPGPMHHHPHHHNPPL